MNINFNQERLHQSEQLLYYHMHNNNDKCQKSEQLDPIMTPLKRASLSTNPLKMRIIFTITACRC